MNQTFFAILVTQVPTFGFTKLAVLLFYKRVFKGKAFQVAVWTMIVLSSIWTIGFFFSELLQCVPISVNWSGSGGTESQCIDVNGMILAQAYSDVFTNIVILALPIPCVSRPSQSLTHS